MKRIILVFLLILGFALIAEQLEINPEKSDIVLSPNTGGIARVAALELQKHLKMITGVEISIREQATPDRYAFCFNGTPQDKKLKPEESVFEVTQAATFFYGDDTPFQSDKSITTIIFRGSKFGTLTAVYDFLEKQFGVRWIWPGDSGIIYPHSNKLLLKTGSRNWKPEFIIRHIGPGYGMWKWKTYEQTSKDLPVDFRLTQEQYEEKALETHLWLRRMRMGRSINYVFGHAFTNWWSKYSKIHPEYFSLQPDGVRRPENPKWPHAVKLCVSNPAVVKQVVENWREAGMPPSINTCENDSKGYCQCPECMKLDVIRPGEEPLTHLTDRYLHFANAIQAEAAKLRPDVVATMYAYSVYMQPPRREKVSPGLVIGFVPFMMEPFELTDTRYRQWREAGTKQLFLRPNDQYVNPCIPMGFEKRLYEHFQLGVKNKIIGTSYDSLHNYWQANGIADYILARAHIDPSIPFEDLLDEYCSAFGGASPEVKDYFNYWRINIFEKKIINDAHKIAEIGKYGNFRRGIMWSIKTYYTASDFDKTDAMLAKGSQKNLTDTQREILKKIQLANKHAHLMWEAISTSGHERLKKGITLLKFRLENKDVLNIDWGGLITTEYIFGDICGIKEGINLVEYSDNAPTPISWYFCPDPKDVGEKEQWHTLPFSTISRSWDLLNIDRAWEQQRPGSIHPKLFELLKEYDGVGWYAQNIKVNPNWKGKDISLLFGGVDESAWVWVNGKLCGKRIYSGGDEWREPFIIPISEAIDWSKQQQTVTVRVLDTGGLGGIYKNVYLVTKTAEE